MYVDINRLGRGQYDAGLMFWWCCGADVPPGPTTELLRIPVTSWILRGVGERVLRVGRLETSQAPKARSGSSGRAVLHVDIQMMIDHNVGGREEGRDGEHCNKEHD